jgi:4,5-dihydroxyphthalate decarboxylase
VPEYQQTAAMWVRGILHDQAGVAPTEISWRTGGLDQPGEERIPLSLPGGLDVSAIPAGQTLGAMLASGELDGVISPRPPACFLGGDARVGRLFPDYRAAEIAWHRATGFFPIMHCLAIRSDVAAAHSGLPLALFEAFARAKALSMGELAMVNVLRVSLPWVAAEYEATRAVMGPDPWPYGYRRNLAELTAMTRYAATDGLAARRVEPAELFHPSVLDAADVL